MKFSDLVHIIEIASNVPGDLEPEPRSLDMEFQIAKEFVKRIVQIKSSKIMTQDMQEAVLSYIEGLKSINRLVDFCNSMNVFGKKITLEDLLEFTEEGNTTGLSEL
jgi:hypothetical protein